MPYQLPADCLNEIFEQLEEDKITLRSCLLANHLCCQVAIRILWRNIWNYCFSEEKLVTDETVINLLLMIPKTALLMNNRNEWYNFLAQNIKKSRVQLVTSRLLELLAELEH